MGAVIITIVFTVEDVDFTVSGQLIYTFPSSSGNGAMSVIAGMICATGNNLVAGNLTFNINISAPDEVQLSTEADMATVIIIDNDAGKCTTVWKQLRKREEF